MNTYIEKLQWRYATKKFDPNKKLEKEKLETLKKAIQLSASSYGLQPYKVFVIEDPELRAKLRPAAWNQPQITDASQLIVFAHDTNFGDDQIDAYIDNVVQTRGLKAEDLKGYADFMKSKITPLPDDVKSAWTARQAYIALGNLLSAAAHLEIDACPMEGFEVEAFNDILGLKEKGLSTAVIATVGYRSDEDDTQHYAKVRKPETELFETL
ncbi:NAD(P)H-dependent oxidoreductase [Robertkochia marina]|uniref:NAD(P)H-dependent oxidoreductase n=1 Tax=Robertkochia marina TaxID=1227945 RepID=A0A4S3LXV7_9FLAO|nr:NAD(P)H-dependent oxidoreductase [Robertkochia marina]THD66399.1 NAD(P)H-dependent oxidoreductase [Robertkochia marina]TRZ44078.1 NAD(P)H-dependent oxidoreductase [Robertkochia marina]